MINYNTYLRGKKSFICSKLACLATLPVLVHFLSLIFAIENDSSQIIVLEEKQWEESLGWILIPFCLERFILNPCLVV